MMQDFSMHVMDIVQNSIRAKARKIEILIDENPKQNYFLFSVADNGCGMDEKLLKSVRDPFSTTRTTRKVGLGIPMLEQCCQMCGGHLKIESILDKGTTITATMQYMDIDRPPLGDIAQTIYILIVTNPQIDFKYTHKYLENTYCIDTDEIKIILGDVSVTNPEIMKWLKANIAQGIQELYTLQN